MSQSKASTWRWVYHPSDPNQRLRDVGANADGTLHNPNGHPEQLVRRAIAAAETQLHERRSKSAKEAAVTRQKRTEQRVYRIAAAIVAGHRYGPRNRCVICRKALSDAASIERGIGSECWQDVLEFIRKEEAQRGEHIESLQNCAP